MITYFSSGYNAWRERSLPSAILQQLCIKNGVEVPKIFENSIEVGGKIFEDSTVLSKGNKLELKL